MKVQKITIISPTYNESGNVAKLIQKKFEGNQKKNNLFIEVLIVDDSSRLGWLFSV